MTKFWVLILAVFVSLLVTVNYVSRRSSQVEVVERASPPTLAPPVPTPRSQPYPSPRSSPSAVSSGALYKCVDSAGHHSFQSQPCPVDSTQAWVRDATPEPEPSPAERRRRARTEQQSHRREAPRSYDPGYSPGSPSMSQDPGSSAACRVARAADAAYRRQPLRYVTHDGLRRHGDRVNAACH